MLLVVFLVISACARCEAHWLDMAAARLEVGPREATVALTFPSIWQPGQPPGQSAEFREAFLQSFFASHIRLVDGEGRKFPCTGVRLSDRPVIPPGQLAPGGSHITLLGSFTRPQPATASLTVSYDLFAPTPSSCCMATLTVDGATRSVVFTPYDTEIEIGHGLSESVGSFMLLGIEHILGGADHLLFLACLLLTGGSFMNVVKIVTAFTVAHSTTLSLAVLGLLSVPGQVVEPAIALSIVWVAVDNLRGQHFDRRWTVAFAFGLLHGLGFAGVLQAMDLPRGALAVALVSFNVGVEIGQVAVVLVLFALLRWLQRFSWESQVRRLASAAVLCVALFWFVQRTVGGE